jgi:hypothetical protein
MSQKVMNMMQHGRMFVLFIIAIDACRPPVPKIRLVRAPAARQITDAVGCGVDEARLIAHQLPVDVEMDRVKSVCDALKCHLSLSRAELAALLVSKPSLLHLSDGDLNFWLATERLAEWRNPRLRGSHGNFLPSTSQKVRAVVRCSPYRQTRRHKLLASNRRWRAEQALHNAVAAASASSSVTATVQRVRQALSEAAEAGVPDDAPQRRRAASLLVLLERAASEEAEAPELDPELVEAEESREAKLRLLFHVDHDTAGDESADDVPPAPVDECSRLSEEPAERYHYRYVLYERPRFPRAAHAVTKELGPDGLKP